MASRILKYLILLACLLLVVAISSFWFSGPSFREQDVSFTIDGPTQVTAGQEVTYKLSYQNNTRSDLSNLNFNFYYPEGAAVLVNGKIQENQNENFAVDTLKPGERGEKDFVAYLIGDKGNIGVAKADLSFRAGSLSSNFEKSITFSTTIVKTPITLTLVAPPNSVSGSTAQYILDYRNTSDDDLSDLMVEFDYPDGFRPKSYDPQPVLGDNTWHIDTIKKGKGGRITVNGILTGSEGDNKMVSVILKRKLDSDYVDYQKSSATTVISNPILGLGMQVNNSTDYTASLGDNLSYTVQYSNNSNINFSGMNLVVKLEGDTFNLGTLNTNGGLYDSSAKTITWDSTTISDFNNFVPGMSGQINFSVSLKPTFSSAIPGSSQDRFVKVSSVFMTPNVPEGFDGNQISASSNLVTKISSQPALNQSVYYNDPNFQSVGPLPMHVGDMTSFNVHWQLTNPGNDINNVEVSAKLPANVQWDNMVWANNGLPSPAYNSSTGTVVWDLPKLPYGTGTLGSKYEASFRVKVIPADSDKGNSIQLIGGPKFAGTDSFSNQTITITRDPVTTNDLSDRPGQGIVQ